MDRKEKIEMLATDEAFLIAMRNAKSKDDIQKIFEAHGLPMTKDEVDAFTVMVKHSTSEELNCDQLEQVAAGGVGAATVFSWAWKGTKAIAKACWDFGKNFANWEQKK